MIRRPAQSSRSISGCPGCFCLCGSIPGAGSLRPHPSMARITGRMDSPGPLRADSRSADSRAPAARGTDDDEAAASSGLTGCGPCHGCIGHAIQDVRGVQLRLECGDLLRAQGRPEQPERAKLTDAYNLPGRYVPHTGSPMATGALGREDCGRPASCLPFPPGTGRAAGNPGPALSAAWQREDSGFPGAYNSRTPQGVRL